MQLSVKHIEAINRYRGPDPRGHIAHELRQRVTGLLIGPPAVGKSYVRTTACAADKNFHRVVGFVTRPRQKRDEPDAYRFLPHNEQTFREIERKLAASEIVNITVHPTTGYVYGTEFADYPAPYNLLDMLSSHVASFLELPFKRSVPIAVATEPRTWHRWSLERFQQISDVSDAHKRLAEGEASLKWSLGQGDNIRWLYNRPGDSAASAQELIAMVRGDASSDQQARELGEAMLASISELRASLESVV